MFMSRALTRPRQPVWPRAFIQMMVLLAHLALVQGAVAQAREHVFPEGAPIGLVPPPGMTLATGFAGFGDERAGASIIVTDFPEAAPFADLERVLTAQNLARQGITAEKKEELTIAGQPAILVTGAQTVQGAGGTVRKWLLLARGPAATALVTVQVPSEAAGYPEPAIRASLTTLVFRGRLSDAERMAAFPFMLRDMGGFRLVHAMQSTSLLLTDGPADVVKGGAQPVVVAATSMGGSLPPESGREVFALALAPLDAGQRRPADHRHEASADRGRAGRGTHRRGEGRRHGRGHRDRPLDAVRRPGLSALGGHRAQESLARCVSSLSGHWRRADCPAPRPLTQSAAATDHAFVSTPPPFATTTFGPPLDTPTSAGRSTRSPMT